MTATRGQIENLVMRIQTDFLEHPTLSLTLPAAQRRFGVDEVTCAGVLGRIGGRPGADPSATGPIAGIFHDSPVDEPPRQKRRTPPSESGGMRRQEAVMIEIRRILCPIDFSDHSRRALDHAIAIARWYESTVTALHVFSPAPVAALVRARWSSSRLS